ncbi:hypothetical protein UA08_00394 [Talaromyces atroroseus]|uniref:Uncharacterized protein n=1 Tax=Talaromyces atroroseus TaxID=1441469 RepID=A0A225BA44_TALAT|nr:hypothetical protein UA08_00394 [Talaromyces atroroseus]OKL64256.1 hypothetical protein UA08_00394 [Talaromyces atroroseus]
MRLQEEMLGADNPIEDGWDNVHGIQADSMQDWNASFSGSGPLAVWAISQRMISFVDEHQHSYGSATEMFLRMKADSGVILILPLAISTWWIPQQRM